jgi:hypothetical protein
MTVRVRRSAETIAANDDLTSNAHAAPRRRGRPRIKKDKTPCETPFEEIASALRCIPVERKAGSTTPARKGRNSAKERARRIVLRDRRAKRASGIFGTLVDELRWNEGITRRGYNCRASAMSIGAPPGDTSKCCSTTVTYRSGRESARGTCPTSTNTQFRPCWWRGRKSRRRWGQKNRKGGGRKMGGVGAILSLGVGAILPPNPLESPLKKDFRVRTRKCGARRCGEKCSTTCGATRGGRHPERRAVECRRRYSMSSIGNRQLRRRRC